MKRSASVSAPSPLAAAGEADTAFEGASASHPDDAAPPHPLASLATSPDRSRGDGCGYAVAPYSAGSTSAEMARGFWWSIASISLAARSASSASVAWRWRFHMEA